MAVIVNGDGILTGISSLATSLTDITSGRGTITGVTTVGTLQLGAGVSISSPRSQQAAIFTNNTEFFTVDDAGRVGVGTITPNSDAHPENEKKINVGFITARSIAGDIDANTMVVAGVSTFVGAINGTLATAAQANVTSLGTLTGLAVNGNITLSDSIIHLGDTDTKIQFPSNDTISFTTNSTEKVRIDSGGRLLIGTATVKSAGAGQYAKLNVEGYVGGNECFASFSRAEAASAMSSGDEVANLTFNDSAGYEFARIQVLADAATGATDTPGRIVFRTTADGASSSTERLRIDSRGDVYLNETSSISSPYSTFNTLSIGNNLILSGYTGGNGGFAGMQQNAYVNSGGSWTKVYDDYAFSIGGDDGAIFFRTAGTGTGSITWDTPLQITNGGVVQIGGNTANSADIDFSNTKLTIKQSGGGQEDGIYIERTGERRGFYIYVGGALGQNDALGIVSNQLGGDTAVLSIDRGGDVVVGAGNIKMNTSGKGIDFSATGDSSGTMSSEVLDDYEEGTFTPTQPTIGTNSASGHYTKIGRYVYASIFMTLPTNSSGVAFYIDSLPFTSLNNSGTNIHGGYAIYSTYGSPFTVRVHDNATRAQVSAIGGANINLSGLDNLNFRIQVHYMTN